MRANRDGVDTHLDDWIVVTTRLSHIAEVEDIFLFNFELFHKVGHTEDFVHAWSDGVDRGGATDFVIISWSKLFGALDDSFALLAIWIPSVLGVSAGMLAEGREGDLAEAVFDDFVAFGKLVFFPVTELFGGSFNSLGDFGDLLVGVIIGCLGASLVYYLLIWIAHIKKPKQLKHVYVPLVTLGLTIFVFLVISVVRTYVL